MPRRSFYRITPRGQQILQSKPKRIDMKRLEQFPEYIEFRDKTGYSFEARGQCPGKVEFERKTPEEALEDAYQGDSAVSVAQEAIDAGQAELAFVL